MRSAIIHVDMGDTSGCCLAINCGEDAAAEATADLEDTAALVAAETLTIWSQ